LSGPKEGGEHPSTKKKRKTENPLGETLARKGVSSFFKYKTLNLYEKGKHSWRAGISQRITTKKKNLLKEERRSFGD